MTATYSLISSQVLSSTTVLVTFSSLPTTYTDLKLVCSVRDAGSGGSTQTGFYLSINSGGNSISTETFQGNGSSALAQHASATSAPLVAQMNGNTSTGSIFSNIECYFPNYNSSTPQPIYTFGAQENASSAAYLLGTASLCGSGPITAIAAYDPATGFASGSSFYLYGIKNS